MSNGNIRLNSAPGFTGSGWSIGASSGCGPQHCSLGGASYDYNLPPAVAPTALTNLEADVSNGTFPAEPKHPTNLPSCSNGSTCPYSPSSSWQGNLTIKNGGTVTLQNGTYFFDSISIGGTLKLAAGATGVNLVIGTGGLSFNGSGTMNLQAAATSTVSSDLNGVLIFDLETGSPTIGGTNGSTVSGAMFFPYANVTWNGNATTSSTCTEIVANTLTFSGNAYLRTSGCSSNLLATSQLVVLVQ
jgi:hypothetical protein